MEHLRRDVFWIFLFCFQKHFSWSKIFSVRVLLQKIGVKKHIYLIIDWPFLSIVFCFENDRILRKRQDFSCFEKGSLSSEAWKCFYAPKRVPSSSHIVCKESVVVWRCHSHGKADSVSMLSSRALLEFGKRCVIYFKWSHLLRRIRSFEEGAPKVVSPEALFESQRSSWRSSKKGLCWSYFWFPFGKASRCGT